MSLAQSTNLVNKIPLAKETLCQAESVLGKRNFENKMTHIELVTEFPQAKKTIKALIEEDQALVDENKKLKETIYNNLWRKLPIQDVEIATELTFALARTDFIEHDIPRRRKSSFRSGEYAGDRLARNRKLLSLFPKKGQDTSFTDKILKAKLIPIESMITLNKLGFARCPFHNEKTASFKVDRKKNLWFDFGGCGGGDSISFYMKLNNCSFKEAVEKMQ